VDLVDDLLEVAADQRLEQPGETRVTPHRVKYWLVIRGPLNHPYQRLAASLRPRDIVEEIAVAKAAPVRDPFGIKLVQRGGEFGHLVWIEKAANDRIPVAPILRELGVNLFTLVDRPPLRNAHRALPGLFREYSSSLRFP
jgi:hypothetical protein